MPLTESQPDALARLYAQSLFELVTAEGGSERAEQILGELEDVVELARSDARFSEFLASRILPAKQRAASLRAIFDGRASGVTLRFLLVLNHKDRLDHLPAVTAAFDHLVQSAFGRVEVDVYTAAPIDSSALDTIRNQLRSQLGKEPIVHPYVDASMLGGLKLQIGDRLIDASVATRLRQVRTALATDGNAEIRAKASRIIEAGPDEA